MHKHEGSYSKSRLYSISDCWCTNMKVAISSQDYTASVTEWSSQGQQLNNERENKKYWTKLSPDDSPHPKKHHLDEDGTEPGPTWPKAGEYQLEPWHGLCRCCLYITFSGASAITQRPSSSSSCICHGVGSLVDPFRSQVSRSLFKGLP